MNFASTERTGRLGEISVELLFVSWSWTVGKDQIDVGYDLTVEPDNIEFSGHRFLVQVKSTAESKKKGRVIAPVDKSRLRQYARNPMPVFIVRIDGDGRMYWLHVQAWAKTNGKRLPGDGTARISIPNTQRLEEKEIFLSYLRDIFEAPAKKNTALAKLAVEREDYLSSIDPRLKVKVELKDGRESYHLTAVDPSVKLKFELELSGSQGGAQLLNDALRFGTPVEIGDATLRFSGSSLLSKLGMTDPKVGTLSIRPLVDVKSIVRIYPGEKYSITAAPPLSFKCRKYQGHEGVAFNTEEDLSLVTFQARLLQRGEATFTLAYRGELVYGKPLRELDELGAIGEWAQEVLIAKTMRMEFIFAGQRLPVTATEIDVWKLSPLLTYAVTLGRLHKIARALNSEFALPEEHSFSPDEIQDITLAYNLLKGHRCKISLGPIEITPDEPPTILRSTAMRINTTLQFWISALALGTISVSIDLQGYEHRFDSESGVFRVEKGEDSAAFIYVRNNRDELG